MRLRSRALLAGMLLLAPSLHAQRVPESLRGGTVTGAGVDVVLIDGMRVPLLAYRRLRMTRYLVAPELAFSGLILPVALVMVGTVSIGPALFTPDGSVGLLLHAGPGIGLVAGFYGAALLPLVEVGAGFLVRGDEGAAIRLDVSRVLSPSRHQTLTAWRVGFHIVELRSPGKPASP